MLSKFESESEFIYCENDIKSSLEFLIYFLKFPMLSEFRLSPAFISNMLFGYTLFLKFK